LRYAYANARVKGMKSKLLPAAKVRELLAVDSVDSVIGLLEDSAYKREFVECSTRYRGIELVGKALALNMARTLATVNRILPEHAQDAFRTLAGLWVLEDLGKVLSKKAAGEAVDETELSLVDDKYAPLLLKLAKARDLRECAKLLQNQEFADDEALAKLAEGDPRMVLAGADGYYWKRTVSNTLASGDAQLLRINRARVDAKNALIILRLKRDGIPADEIRKRLLPSFVGSRYNAIIEAGDLNASIDLAAKMLGVPESAAAAAKQGRLSALEVAIERGLVERVLRESRLSVLGMGAITGFLYLKWTEIGNIRKIAYATHYGLKEELGDTVFTVKAS